MKSKIAVTFVFLLIVFYSNGQLWEKNLPRNKNKFDLTLKDHTKAFNDYWEPFNVVNGYYTNAKGKKMKAAGWKQFKRWEYFWEPQVNPDGSFPNVDIQNIYEEYLQQNPILKSTSTGNWHNLGPESSGGGYAGVGRINCVAFHPNNPNVYWIGSASGGVWQTVDNGNTWQCLTDNNAVLGVSDILILPDYETSNTIYIATGDRDGFDNHSVGVLKSTDNGITWNSTGLNFGLGDYGMVSRLLVDPNDNSAIIAATSQGVYKTTNGGTNWDEQLSFLSFIDMEYKPGDFNTLYGSTKYGDIYVSHNAGVNWTLEFESDYGRVELAVSANQSTWVYAIVGNSMNGLQGIYKSVDSGNSFQETFSGTTSNLLGWESDGSDEGGQAWYDLAIAISPANANVLLIGGINTWRSTDGGSTWECKTHWYGQNNITEVHADKHMLKFRNDGSLFECNDGGIYISSNNGDSYSDKTNGLVISQMYKLGVSQTNPELVITGLQDNGTKLYSNSSWGDVLGGDGMECFIDFTNANNQVGSLYYGNLRRTTNNWLNSVNITPEGAGDGSWVTPIVIDPNNPNVFYAGYSDIWKTENQGDSWTKISAINLTYKFRSIAVANSNPEYIYAAGTSDLYRTIDGGSAWTDLSSALPGSVFINGITVKNDDPYTVWIACGRYDQNTVYESTDGGQTWTNISSGLPELPVYTIVQNIQETKTVHLYAGAEVGVYFKEGTNNWTLFSTGLPNVSSRELEICYAEISSESKIKLATYGRGLWESNLVEVSTSEPMVFNSATTSQANLDNVMAGLVNQEILGIEMVTSGSSSPLTVSEFTFNTNGTTNTSDIKNARLWYTGRNNSFSCTSQFGAAVLAPNGTFNINGSQTLQNGTNYFWLTYDIKSEATLSNEVDAQCTALIIEDTTRTLTVTAPAGARTIIENAVSNIFAINEHSVVYTDNGLFYDSGLENDYSNNEDEEIIFYPATEGGMLQFDFLEFYTESGYDFLSVYDGVGTNYNTLIGSFDGLSTINTPIIASNQEGALTFHFTSDASVVQSGWKAQISTIITTVPSYTLTCSDVTIENGTITSCSYDFSNTDIIIPDTLCDQLVTGIGNNVFSSKGITSIKMPSTLVSIGTMAFQSNPFKQLDLSVCTELSYIGSYAFANSEIEEIWLPGSLEILGTACFSDNHMTHLNGVPFDGIFYQLSSGSVDSSWVNSYGGLSDVVEVPAWVQTVGAWAYSGADLIEVVLNQGLENIQYQAFSRNRLTVINLPDQLYFIGNNAFEWNSLYSILIPGSVVNIGRNAFGFNNLVEVAFEPKSNIAQIDVNAFADNSGLVSVVLPTHASLHFLNYFDNLGNIYFAFDAITDFSLSYTSNIDPDLGCPQFFHPVWEDGNPNDPMNIFIVGAKIDGEDLVAGDQIGVFDGDLCVGYGKVVQTLNNTTLLSIVAGSDDGSGNGFISGHEITYKIWRCNDTSEFENVEVECFSNQLTPVSCSAFQSGASSFVELSVSTRRSFATDFQPGWNIFSLPVLLDLADIEFTFSDLISSNSLVKIQDESGASLEDLGVFGGWNNEIGDIRLTEGYKVKVSEYDSLYTSGSTLIYPFAIPLNSGWNIIGFPSFSVVNGMEVVQQLIDNGTLIKVQNEQGNSIENLGIFGGWQNFIGNFQPGEGYKIKVSSQDSLWIYESYPKSTITLSKPLNLQHFNIAISGNGVDHMNFNLVNVNEKLLAVGDEISVYDGTTCAGAMVVAESHLRNRLVSIPASATDESGMPGFTEGNKYSLRIWKADQNREIEVETEHISGPEVFTKHESVILSLDKSALTKTDEWNGNGSTEVNCYPNPFSQEITIELILAVESKIQVVVLNQMGQEVKYLATKSDLNSGIHRLTWDGSNSAGNQVPHGMYYLKIVLDDLIICEKIIYNKL